MEKEHEVVHVESNQRQLAREQFIAAMLEGRTFREVSAGSPPPVKRAMAYRLLCAVRAKGDIALQDGRHGHPIKLRGEARAFLEACCRETPYISGLTLQAALRERFDLQVSVSQINRVRAALGVSNPSKQSVREKKTEELEASSSRSEWLIGAGSLLLLAAVQETELLSCLETALTSNLANASPSLRVARSRSATLRGLLLTLLFLHAVGLQRTWDLRGYSSQALALLTGRSMAYSYRHTERFLAELASIGADAPLTETLARWTASLWEKDAPGREDLAPVFYVDGHRKPVYADALIPRGLIGRTGKVLGCRALVLLHDQEGHPLLVTTHRGDQHLTIGLPAILARYEQAAGLENLKRIVVDREGMAAEFLAGLASEGRTVVTVLRTDQYAGLESFREVGAFVPLHVDQQGKVIREVALGRFGLPLPEHSGQELEVWVALIRDWRRLVPKTPPSEEEDRPLRWDEKPDGTHEYWLDESWQATPLPAPPMEPKLIPIVTTAAEADAVELVQTYTRRWPAQENAIRDWLIPLGIDINHGYAKTAVANSEVTKKREALQRRLEHVQRWTNGARKRMHNASKLYRKRCQQTKERADTLYRDLNHHQIEMERQGVEHWLLRKTIKEEKAVADAEIEKYRQRQWKAYHTSNKEFAKCEKYCREQRELLRAIEDLSQQEREMYELDNRKDQVMTVFKVALANLGMWVRDHYFPASYAHASWHRLQPFFQLPGRIFWERDRVEVELKRFNDRALNRDLEALCAKVSQRQLGLPDGRRLLFRK